MQVYAIYLEILNIPHTVYAQYIFKIFIFSYKRNQNSRKTKLACIVKRRKHYIYYAILLISAACIDCFTKKDNRCPFWLHLSDLYTGILC